MRSPLEKWETPVGGSLDLDEWEDEDIRTSPIFSLVENTEVKVAAKGDSETTPYKEHQITQVEKKRKWVEPSPQDRKAINTLDFQAVSKMLGKVVMRTKKLNQIVSESTKTKLEIKKATNELHYLVNNLEKAINEYHEKQLGFVPPAEKKTVTAATQTDANNISVGIQTVEDDIEIERQRAEKKSREEIKESLKSDSGFAGIKDLLDRIWPADVYIQTKTEVLSRTTLNAEGDFAILCNPREIERNKVLENLILTHPDLKEVISKNEGQIDYLIKTVATKTKNNESSEKTTVLYVLPLKVDKTEVNGMDEVYNVLKELKTNMAIHPTKIISLVLSEHMNQEYIRKISEYVFSNSNVNITVVTPREKHQTIVNKTMRPQTEKVIVKAGNTQYADLLKTVKEKVDINQIGIRVKSIKKTMRGDIMLEVEGDKQKAGLLKEAINEKVQNEVRLTNNTVTIHILDVDATTTKEEVANTIRRIVGSNDPQEVTIRSMRPSRDGNQIVTVQAPRAKASILVKAGKIKIGWVNCRVRERVAVERCYRCLDFGHRKNECKGPDRSDRCLNCNQAGHKARECTGTHFCPKCETNDHRADTTRCPSFRKLVNTKAKQRKPNIGVFTQVNDN